VITGIIVALPEELGTLTAKRLTKGDIYKLSENILLAYSGTGPVNAKKAAEKLLDKGAVKLISWGCSAALVNHLKPGNLLLPEQIIRCSGQPVPVHSLWLAHTHSVLTEYISTNTGNLAESDIIVSSSHEKKQLQLKTQAVAVDMESAAIASLAEQKQLPFLAIRTIADPVNMDLPPAIEYALDEEGDIRLPKLISHILLNPLEIPGLVKLGLHFAAARKTLSQISQHLDKITGFAST